MGAKDNLIRLIEKGLMFGNLVHISSPALIERYNRALQHLAGKTTALTDFHVDISGYSPEVGIELDDELYLNPNGVNRQFILLTTEQKRAPLLNVKFSTSRDILREFIEMNEAQLFALTATDAVAGELVNSVFKLTTPRDLLNLRKIEIEADTAGGTLRKAEQLAGMVERFKTKEDAWFDDVLIAKMIETAKETGDVTRNPVRLRHTAFEQRNFWTAHFGGLYLFPDLDHPAAICMGEKPDDLPIKYIFDPSQRNQIAKFLDYNDLVEPIVKARGVDAAAILQQKMDFLTVAAAADADVDLTGLDRSDMRRLARNHSDRLPECLSRPRAAAALGERWGPVAAHHLGSSGLFLYAARGGYAQPRSGQHAAGRTGSAGPAPDVHLPQGTCSTAPTPTGPRPRKPMLPTSSRASIRWTRRAPAPRCSGMNRT